MRMDQAKKSFRVRDDKHDDIRSTPSSTLPVEPNPSPYNPSSNSTLSNKEFEKRVFNICKGNNSVFLMYLPTQVTK